MRIFSALTLPTTFKRKQERLVIAELRPQSPHHFTWQPSAPVSQTFRHPTSVTWLQLPRKQTNTGTPTSLTAQIDLRAHDFAHSPDLWRQTRLATLPAPEVENFVELILLYHCSPQATWLVWFDCTCHNGFYRTLSASLSVKFLFIMLTHAS